MFGNEGKLFEWYGSSHLIVVFILLSGVILLFTMRKKNVIEKRNVRKIEKLIACSLLIIESLYYVWAVKSGIFSVKYSLPLELCSFSLYASILLLWTNNEKLYPFVFFSGIGGAIQAIFTPALEFDFPHFRFFHFFYLHLGIIFTALYFTWVKRMRPTFKTLLASFLTLNVLALTVSIVNYAIDANYMFLKSKPVDGSLLDYLGPYPYYIFVLEFVAFMMFILLWLLFRKPTSKIKRSEEINKFQLS